MLFHQPTKNGGSSVPSEVITSGNFATWARDANQADLNRVNEVLHHRDAAVCLSRWLQKVERNAGTFCESMFQDASHRSYLAGQDFHFVMGLRPQVYSRPALQLRFNPQSDTERVAAAAALAGYRKALSGQAVEPGNLRNSKALGGRHEARPTPPMPGVSLVPTAAAPSPRVHLRASCHPMPKVAATIASIVLHLREPGPLILVPLRKHTSPDHHTCPDLIAEVFQQAPVQCEAGYLAFDSSLPVRNYAHRLLGSMNDSSLGTLINTISSGKASWSAHPILCAMQAMWVKAATPPISWQSHPNVTCAVLLTLDLGFHCSSNPNGFPRYYESVHAAVATNPDLTDVFISGTNFVTVTVDFRQFAEDLGVEGWGNGVQAAVDRICSQPGALQGLVSHIIQQGVINTVADWRSCLRY